MTNRRFLRCVQSRAARLSVGVSAVRGQPEGTVEAARTFLLRIDLDVFGTFDGDAVAKALDRTTVALKRALPADAQHWGLARKLLNIFLINCFYTTYLNKAFRLDGAKHFL